MALRRQQAQEENEARDLSKQFKVDQLVRDLQEKNGFTYMAALRFVTTSSAASATANQTPEINDDTPEVGGQPQQVAAIKNELGRRKSITSFGDELAPGLDSCSSADELDVGDNNRVSMDEEEEEEDQDCDEELEAVGSTAATNLLKSAFFLATNTNNATNEAGHHHDDQQQQQQQLPDDAPLKQRQSSLSGDNSLQLSWPGK